jgi:hypothetical protein
MERYFHEHQTHQHLDHIGNSICRNSYWGASVIAVENCRRTGSSAAETGGSSTKRPKNALQRKGLSEGHSLTRGLFASAVIAIAALQPVVAMAADALDTLQNTVKSTTAPWMDSSLQLATVLFSIMMTVTFITALMRYVSLNHTIEGFGHAFMDLFIKVIPLYVIMASATTFLPNIVNVANQLSGQITGISVNGPDEILAIGTKLCENIFSAVMLPFTDNGVQLLGATITGSPVLFLSIFGAAVGVITALVIIISFALIAFEYFFAFAQAYITLSVGAISLGWLASPGTKNMGEQYLSAAWVSVMRLVLTIACVSFIATVVPPMQVVSVNSDPNTMMMTYLKLCSAAIFAALLAIKVPSFATNMFSGHPAVSAAEVASSVIRAARKTKNLLKS